MNINLSEIFVEFLNNLDTETKNIFNEYFLGFGTNSPILLDEYIRLLKRSLRYRTDLGYRRVNYIRQNPDSHVHAELNLHSAEEEYINSLYVATQSYKGKYPKITLRNYEYYTAVVFLIHPLIKNEDIQIFDLLRLAEKWYNYSIREILGIKYPTCIYRYANANEIYHSNKKLNTSELRKIKIYTNRIFGKERLLYE